MVKFVKTSCDTSAVPEKQVSQVQNFSVMGAKYSYYMALCTYYQASVFKCYRNPHPRFLKANFCSGQKKWYLQESCMTV